MVASTDTLETPAPVGEKRWLKRIALGWRIFRTGLGWLTLGLSSLALGLIVLPLLRIAPGLPEQRELRAQRAIHWAVRVYLRMLSLLWVARIRHEGEERLREPGKLIVATHPTLLDALLLMSLMPQADLVVKQGYYDNPFLAATLGICPADIAIALIWREVRMSQNRHRNYPVITAETDPANADGGTAFEHPNVDDRKPDTLACPRSQQDVVALTAQSHTNNPIVVVQLHGDLAVRRNAAELGQVIASDIAAGSREHHVLPDPFAFIRR
jgi:hypothetical protein